MEVGRPVAPLSIQNERRLDTSPPVGEADKAAAWDAPGLFDHIPNQLACLPAGEVPAGTPESKMPHRVRLNLLQPHADEARALQLAHCAIWPVVEPPRTVEEPAPCVKIVRDLRLPEPTSKA